jgi:hypothetical protein
METITINVLSDFYGNPSYYSVMPEAIFDALELGIVAWRKKQPPWTRFVLKQWLLTTKKRWRNGKANKTSLAAFALVLQCSCTHNAPRPAHECERQCRMDSIIQHYGAALDTTFNNIKGGTTVSAITNAICNPCSGMVVLMGSMPFCKDCAWMMSW